MHHFRTYQSAVEFYRLSRTLSLETHLKDQLKRAASSIALNLSEGNGKRMNADRERFFQIAFGSTRECQAILELAELKETVAWKALDSVAAQLYRLTTAGR